MHAAKRVLSPSKADNVNAQPKKFKQLPEIDNKTAPCSDDLENYEFLLSDDDFDLCAVMAAEQQQTTNKLNLCNWQRCIVQQVERQPKTYDLVLHLVAEDGTGEAPATAKCHLQGAWSHTQLQVGDLVSVQAQWQPELNCYAINKDHGFCVTNPDMLISGTTVTGSLFCRRKAVLQDRFRGVDAGNAVMVIGSLVHELLQTVLAQRLHTKKSIDCALQDMLKSSNLAHTLYENNMKYAEVRTELEKFVEPIESFVKQYVQGQEPAVMPPNMYQGCIKEIQDIEENLWVPQLGLKGKVDVSVRVRSKKQAAIAADQTPIPLELKTGRASFSMEHKGQLMLYQLMQTALGKDTHSGLLLYLREGIMREVRSSRNEQRDLIALRNDLAYYLTREAQLPPMDAQPALEQGKLVQPIVLPEPISHHSACGNCAYNIICCSFAATDPQLQLRDSHPLSQLMKQNLEHLNAADYEYFMRWCSFLALEEQSARQSQNLRALWTEKPETRQKRGHAVCGLELRSDSKIIAQHTRFEHTLELAKEAASQLDLTLSGFNLGEYVIISTTQRLAIAAGFITALTPTSVNLQLERNLRQKYANASFIMDKHESQSFNVFNYTNLGLLLDNVDKAARLRAIVIARQPRLNSSLDATKQYAHILAQLNAKQHAAAISAISTENYLLIKGLPGTGKTQTLVAIVRLLHLLKQSVLITAQTHSAVDNLLLRLLPYELPMLRLGSSARIHAQLQHISEESLTHDCKNEEQLRLAFEKPTIVGVTCLGAAHALFLHRQFDYCIVDEATQVMQPTVLRPLWHSNKFILVGDPQQLPPLIRSREARKRGADESLFERLDSEQNTKVLTYQYRMNRNITKLANELTYNGELRCGSEQVEQATLQLNQAALLKSAKWLQQVLAQQLDQSVWLLDTQNCTERIQQFSSSSRQLNATCAAIEEHYGLYEDAPTKLSKRNSKYTNYCEAAVVFYILRQLLAAGYEAERIGIIAPYRVQVELLRKLATQTNDALSQVEFNTVDQYQGRDKNVIIYSCTKTGAAQAEQDASRSHEQEILEDQRRLTVAITRAKHKLIVLGDALCLQRYTPFRQLFGHIPACQQMRLEDDLLEFSWQTLLQELSQLMS